MLLTVVFFFESELLCSGVQCAEISVSMKAVYQNTSSVTKGAAGNRDWIEEITKGYITDIITMGVI